jgi:hypothetical protein
MSIRVVSFGEVLWDIIDGKEYIGGGPSMFRPISPSSAATLR